MPQQEIIARYSVWMAAPAALSMVAIGLVPFVLPPLLHQGPLDVLKDSNSHTWGIVYGWFVGPFIFLTGAVLLVQIFFQSRKAIWLKDGAIVCMSRHIFCVPCRDVKNVFVSKVPGPLFKYPAIVVELKKGGQKLLPLVSLSERADVVVARLKAVCQTEGA